MANPREVKRTVTISATPEVWRKLERFFALMHYNAGHTAIFGLPFDGDGADSFKVDPPPPEELRKPAQRIGDASATLEIANEGSYYSRHVRPYPYYALRGDELWRVKEGDWPESKEVMRRYE